ncbi:MAG: hypothetical protein WCY12_01205 [Candidatus Omnitrophota bacterium]|jgi:hypothetical protein
MKMSKFLVNVVFVTLFFMLYTWQQTEIYRMAYVNQKNMSVAQDLLDKNTLLRYNIAKNTSLTRIGVKVSGDTDFQMPDRFQMLTMVYPKGALRPKVVDNISGRQNVLARIFGIKRQAEAMTVNQ